MNKKWDAQIIKRTEDAFNNFNKSSLSNLVTVCMKNIDGRFGMIMSDMIRRQDFRVISYDGKTLWKYDSLTDMTDNGWVVD